MDDHAPKTDADYKVFMDCVRDYVVFLENWIAVNRAARERGAPRALDSGKPPVAAPSI